MTTRTYHRLWLYPQQEQALFDEKRFGVTEASTKTGKTTSALIWLTEQALFAPARYGEFWWVAPSAGQARMAFTRLVALMPAGFARVRRSSPLTVTLPNGNAIVFRTGENPDLLYGEDVRAVVLDEYTRMREETWWAIQSTLTATHGPARLIGNVRGMLGWGFRLARQAEAGDPDWHYARLTWRDGVAAGVIDIASVEMARRQLPRVVFQELYEARANDDGTHPIGLDAIEACATLEGPIEAEPLVWGWDLGRHRSWTAGIALDARGRVCRMVRFKTDWERTINRIVQETGSAIALVDATHGSVGDPVLTFLQQDGREARFIGFEFTEQSREKLLDQLAVTIQRGEVSMPREGYLRSELEALEWQPTARHQVKYGFPEGMSGDLVMAMGLAVRQLKHVSRGLETWGGGSVVLQEETLEDKVKRLGAVFPGE